MYSKLWKPNLIKAASDFLIVIVDSWLGLVPDNWGPHIIHGQIICDGISIAFKFRKQWMIPLSSETATQTEKSRNKEQIWGRLLRDRQWSRDLWQSVMWALTPVTDLMVNVLQKCDIRFWNIHKIITENISEFICLTFFISMLWSLNTRKRTFVLIFSFIYLLKVFLWNE